MYPKSYNKLERLPSTISVLSNASERSVMTEERFEYAITPLGYKVVREPWKETSYWVERCRNLSSM
jgi:hypothetical protein